jgi:putative ABC transport system ATP-binding protein
MINDRSRAVQVRSLTVDFVTPGGVVHALAPLDLDIEAGTGVAIMGPSGCGKSTLLGVIAGLSSPTTGTVTIGSDEISSLKPRDRLRFRLAALGMMYQADNLLPHLTVEENVGLQRAISGVGRDGAAVAEVLDRLSIGHLAERLPDHLSGGQRQRAALARAIVHGPSVILADEPTGALDTASARAAIELLVDVHRQIGATLVVVTHDPAVAAHLSTTVQLTGPTAATRRAS